MFEDEEDEAQDRDKIKIPSDLEGDEYGDEEGEGLDDEDDEFKNFDDKDD